MEPGIEEKVDPVYRCDSCQALILYGTLKKLGSCDVCGNKRMRNVTIFNDVEKKQMEDWGLEKFLSQFEEVTEDTPGGDTDA